jgi:hypothetical protein
MIDFLFGKDRSAKEFFGDNIAQKYKSVAAIFSLDGKDHKLERQWSDTQISDHVFVDGRPLDSRHLSEFFLNSLKIPVLQFPKSRALADYAWVELGWRVLLRHIYRQEKYWADIADRQPTPEQHAAVLQFFGLAEQVYSKNAQRYNELRRELIEATARKTEFESLISEVAEGILPDYRSNTGLTEDLLDSVVVKLKREMTLIVEDRTQSLERAIASQPKHGEKALSAIDLELGSRRVDLLAQIESAEKDKIVVSTRIQKLEHAQSAFEEELARLGRARTAGEILVDLKVTHCPVCDQQLESTFSEDGECYCCKQRYEQPKTGDRLDFESSQLREEYNETTELLDSLRKQEAGFQRILDVARDELGTVETNLQPARSKVAGFLPPEVGILDVKRGKLDEKISNANKLKAMLRSRRALSIAIDRMTAELRNLEATLHIPENPVKWQQSADKLSDGINTYLGLVRLDGKRWNQGKVTVKLTERYFKFEIDGSDWGSKLGGNYRCVFLVAYHYSLFKVTSDADCHYPGLAIIDFPPNPTNQLGTNKTLNYLLEPFVDLAAKSEMHQSQIIVASRELQAVQGAHTIRLEKQWA